MKIRAGIMCLLFLLYCVYAAPRHSRNRRAEKEKISDNKADNKQEHEAPGSRNGGQQRAEKKQYVPYVPAYNMGDVISEDSQPVQVVQIRDLSITNGVIKKSNIVQL